MTKEEILEEADDKHPYDLGEKTVTERAALEAMSQFSKQEIIMYENWKKSLGVMWNFQESILLTSEEHLAFYQRSGFTELEPPKI